MAEPCEFCGEEIHELARTRNHVWISCRRCQRSWREDLDAATAAAAEYGAGACCSTHVGHVSESSEKMGCLRERPDGVPVVAIRIRYIRRIWRTGMPADHSGFFPQGETVRRGWSGTVVDHIVEPSGNGGSSDHHGFRASPRKGQGETGASPARRGVASRLRSPDW